VQAAGSADHWDLTLEDQCTKQSEHIKAKAVVNAAGPWVRQFIDHNSLAQTNTYQTRLSKGSHIVVRKLFDGDQAYILQQPDGRIIFAIPYEQDFTLIGTTDAVYEGDPKAAQISPEEVLYLCESINRSFKAQVDSSDLVWSYSGVRPLLDSGDDKLSKVTRDYKLDVETAYGPPLLNVFGGKLTTFRHLAEHAVNELAKFFPQAGGAWTENAPLPGGDMPDYDRDKFTRIMQQKYPFLPPHQLQRYVRAYATRMQQFLQGAQDLGDLGAHYGDDLYEAEIRYLIEEEWARTSDDILWRRSKLGLHIAPETKKKLEAALPDLVRNYNHD
jgi:glycerol-3-phosphate dehydrogenase